MSCRRLDRRGDRRFVGSPVLFLLVALIGGMPASSFGATALDFTGTADSGYQADLTLGWKFTVHQAIIVDGLGYFDSFSFSDGPGLNHDHRVRIWTADDQNPVLLATTTITNASTPVPSTAAEGEWLFNEIDGILLVPGDYVIGGDDPGCSGTIADPCDRVRQAVTATTIPQISFVENRDGPIGYPGQANPQRDDAYFGPTFRAEVAVVPVTTAAWLALPVMGLAIRQARKLRRGR